VLFVVVRAQPVSDRARREAIPGTDQEAVMDREQHDIDTDPPMPPTPMRDRDAVADEDVRRPDGEPPVPPVPMRDREDEPDGGDA
jgi:hypothetical protein